MFSTQFPWNNAMLYTNTTSGAQRFTAAYSYRLHIHWKTCFSAHCPGATLWFFLVLLILTLMPIPDIWYCTDPGAFTIVHLEMIAATHYLKPRWKAPSVILPLPLFQPPQEKWKAALISDPLKISPTKMLCYCCFKVSMGRLTNDIKDWPNCC